MGFLLPGEWRKSVAVKDRLTGGYRSNRYPSVRRLIGREVNNFHRSIPTMFLPKSEELQPTYAYRWRFHFEGAGRLTWPS